MIRFNKDHILGDFIFIDFDEIKNNIIFYDKTIKKFLILNKQSKVKLNNIFFDIIYKTNPFNFPKFEKIIHGINQEVSIILDISSLNVFFKSDNKKDVIYSYLYILNYLKSKNCIKGFTYNKNPIQLHYDNYFESIKRKIKNIENKYSNINTKFNINKIPSILTINENFMEYINYSNKKLKSKFGISYIIHEIDVINNLSDNPYLFFIIKILIKYISQLLVR